MPLADIDSQVLEWWYGGVGGYFALCQAQVSNTDPLVFRQQHALLISMLSHKHQQRHM